MSRYSLRSQQRGMYLQAIIQNSDLLEMVKDDLTECGHDFTVTEVDGKGYFVSYK